MGKQNLPAGITVNKSWMEHNNGWEPKNMSPSCLKIRNTSETSD